MVVGDREVDSIEHFSPLKKSLQRLGSWVVRQASDTYVPDTTSGFRAYNREAAIQLAVVSKFTYTLETIIQAGKLLVATDHVPVKDQPEAARVAPVPLDVGLRAAQQRLDLPDLRAVRAAAGLHDAGVRPRAGGAVAVWTRFIVAYIGGAGSGHVQSLILGAVLFNAAVVLCGARRDRRPAVRPARHDPAHFERVRRIELQLGIPPSHYEPGARATEPAAHHRRARRPRGPRNARRSSFEPDRDGRPRGHGHRQHLRQVRLDEPRRQAPDGAASRARSRRCSSRPRPLAARCRLRRGRADPPVGAADRRARGRNRPRRPAAARGVEGPPVRRTSSTWS